MSDPQLVPAMRNLASRVAAVGPPGDLEAGLLAEFDRVHPARSRRAPLRFWPLAGALAASLVAAVLLSNPSPRTPVAPGREAETQAFYPIPYTPPLQPYERVLVVETSVPVTELIAAGFHVPMSDPGASVRADVMVSQDGRPRAIRPVSFTTRGAR